MSKGLIAESLAQVAQRDAQILLQPGIGVITPSFRTANFQVADQLLDRDHVGILYQAISDGSIKNLQHGRKIVKNSLESKKYKAKEIRKWDEIYNTYKRTVRTKI